MIQSWNQFNENKQLDLFQNTPYAKPELIHNNLYPMDEDDIRDYLTEIEDEGYSIVVNFGFLSPRNDVKESLTGGYTELINSYDVIPCISVNIEATSNVGNDDVTTCLTSFVKRVSNKFKKIKVRDDEGFLNIEDIKLEGGIFLKSGNGNIEDEIQLISPVCIQLTWFEDVHLTDKMIYEYYGFTQDKDTRFTEKGSAQIAVPRDRISDWIIPNKSDYKDIIDDPDYDIYQWYDCGDWYPEHDSFFTYHLENETIDLLLRCCFKNFDELKEEYPEFLEEYSSLEDFIQNITKPKDRWSNNWGKLGKFLDKEELAGNIYNELRSKYADYSMHAKADEDYKAVMSDFDESVEEELGTTIIEKFNQEEKKRYRTKDRDGREVWKETTYERPYYRLDFNLEWLSRLESSDLFDLDSVEDEIGEWFYNNKDKIELNPRLSDYADVDDKEFNKEARADIKWQMERQ
jgi:hypothetical protein